MTITSGDDQALDLLSTPSSIRVHLVRSLANGSDAMDDDAPRRSNNFFRETVARAFFWPRQDGAPEPGKRILEGEVDVKKNLKPSFIFPRFAVRVSIIPFFILDAESDCAVYSTPSTCFHLKPLGSLRWRQGKKHCPLPK
jgi:hypothetical protein